MYTIIYGIPAMGNYSDVDGISINSRGHIIDSAFEQDEGIWCDFEVACFNDGTYGIDFETMLGFEKEDGCVKWIKYCFKCFTEYMNSKGLDTSKELDFYEVFTLGINVNSKFKSLEDLYAWFKMTINGYNGKGMTI